MSTDRVNSRVADQWIMWIVAQYQSVIQRQQLGGGSWMWRHRKPFIRAKGHRGQGKGASSMDQGGSQGADCWEWGVGIWQVPDVSQYSLPRHALIALSRRRKEEKVPVRSVLVDPRGDGRSYLFASVPWVLVVGCEEPRERQMSRLGSWSRDE